MKKTNIYARLAMTYLVMLIMLMQSVQAQTQTSTITIGDQKYMLYAGFSATEQAAKSLVDNNLATTWDVSFIYPEGEVPNGVSYVEFQLDKAIVPRGCVLNYFDAVLSDWVLMAKCNPNDEWTTIIVANPECASALEVSCPCSNEDNQAYKYFRFEVQNGILPSRQDCHEECFDEWIEDWHDDWHEECNNECHQECDSPSEEGGEENCQEVCENVCVNVWGPVLGPVLHTVCNNVCNTEYFTHISELRIYGNYCEPISARKATCTEVGIKQDCYVDADGKYYADANGETELTDVEIPKLPHTCVHYQASGDCVEYWQCSVCNKYFKDEACTYEVEHVRIVKYLDDKGVLTELQDKSSIVTSDATLWTDGWYVVFDDATISDRITVRGDVHLILGNGATLTASRGITVEGDATFSIYAQSDKENEMGALIATASYYGYAGIGGASQRDAGAITINGGKINASGNGGAGIGSANYASVGIITINGGVVAAQISSQLGSSIGCGSHGCAEIINFNGGIVNAQGIGSDKFSGACNIIVNITNGVKKIVANRIQYSSGCFGKSDDGTITINFLNNGVVVSGDDKDAVFLDFDDGEQRIIRSRTTNHTITLSENIKNSVTCSDEYAFEGETITP